jgi:uncharacterized protein involved in exopolysaccharide biosynthesis
MGNPYLGQDNQANGVRDFLSVVFKHKTKIVTVFIAVVVTVTATSFLMAPVYKAESSLLVKMGREYLNRPEVGRNEPVMSLSQEEITNSEIQILTNRDLAEQVISSLKLENIYPGLLENPPAHVKPLDMAVVKFQKNLKVEAVKKSNVIHISFQHKEPRIASAVVNRLVELFKEKHLQVFSDPRSSFLEKQLAEYSQKLKESENNLQSFKQKSGAYSLEEQRSLLLNQRSLLDTALLNSRNSISELQKKIMTLKSQMRTISENKALFTNTERERIIVEAKSRLLALQLNEQELLKKYTENNRLVVNARKEIQMVQDFLREQEADINSKVRTGNQVYQSTEMERIKAEADLSAQKAKAVVLQQQLAELDGKIRSLDLSEKDIQKLKREQAINEKNFQTYVEKSEEARITDDMNRLKMANISVIQGASVPIRPVRPNKLLNIVLGIIAGMMAGLGWAYLSESTAQSFSDPEKLEYCIGLPVLAVIARKEG